MSSPSKKGLLWNVLDPGDPYDIRKSLIARIPGDRKIFMGEHIQMVCLLQAVEIQRLIQYLNDYKLKYKEIQRNEFDRHSMQTQIKQLLEMNSDSQLLKIEVTKLREFIRRLSEELDHEKKQNKTVDESLQVKYQQALNKLELFVVEKEQLFIRIRELENSLSGWKERYQVLDKTRLFELEQARGESQRQRLLDRELKDLNNRFNLQRNQYQTSIKYLKQLIDSKDQQINNFHLQISETNRSISIQQNQLLKNQQTKQFQYKKQIQFLNDKLMNQSMKYQQIMIKHQTLITQHAQHNHQYEDLIKGRRKYEDEIQLLNNSLHKLQSRLNERVGMDGKLQDAENKIALLSQQIERLEYMNTGKSKEIDELGERNGKIGYEYESLRRQYLIATNKLGDLEKSQSNIYELQSTVMKLTQENNVLKGDLSYKDQTIRKLNNDQLKMQPELIEVKRQLSIFSQENMKFRNRIGELTMALDESSRSQINVGELEKRLRMLENQRDYAVRQSSDLNKTLHEMQSEINNSSQYQRKFLELRNLLESQRNRSTVEKQSYQQRMKAIADSHQQQLRVMQSQLEYSRRNVDESELLKSNYSRVLEERDTLNDMAHQLQQRLRSFGGEERIIRFNQQIEKLSRRLRQKNDELIDYQRRLKQSQHFKIKYYESVSEVDNLRKKIQLLEPVQNKQQQYKIVSLTKQIQSLRKQLNAQDFKTKIIDYEKRVTLFSEEIDRLNEKIEALKEQNDSWRQKYNSAIDERDQLDEIAHQLQEKLRKMGDSSGEVSDLRRKIHQYQERIVMISTELERFRQSNKRLEGGSMNYQNSISSLNIQIERLKGIISKQSVTFSQSEKKLTTMSQQINRLNEVLEHKVNECNLFEKQVSKLNRIVEKSKGYDEENARLGDSNRMLKAQIKELQQQIRSSTVGLHSLKGENDGLRRRISDFQLTIRTMNETQIQRDQYKRQFQQRSLELTASNDRLRSLTSQYDKLSLELKSKQSATFEVTRITSQFNQKISFITQDNQRLKSQYDESVRKNNTLELSIQKLNHQIDLMSIKIREVDSYAGREEKYKQQIERLNHSVILKESQIAGLEKNITQLETGKQRAILLGEELQKSKIKNNQLMGRISEFETKIFSYTSQIETVRSKLQFSEEKVKRLNEIQNREAGLVRQKELIIAGLNDEISEYKQKIVRLNVEWNIKITTIQNDYRTLQNSKRMLQKDGEGFQRLYEESKIQIRKLQDQRANLRIQLTEVSNNKESQYKSQILSFQNKISSYEDRISSLNSDNQGLRRKISTYEYEISDYKKRITSTLEQRSELQELRLKIREVEIEKQGSYSRLISIGNEVQRLNQVLKLKIEQIQVGNRKINQLTMESNQTRIKISQLNGQNQGLKLTISDLNIRLQSQNSSSNRIYELKIEEKNNKILQYENKLALLSQQIERLEEIKRTGSQKIHILQSKLSQSERSILSHEQKLIALTHQLQRLNNVLKNKLQLEQQLVFLRSENEKLQKTLKLKLESEDNAAKYLSQIERLNNTLRIKVQESKQMESSRFLYQKNDAKIASYSIQIQRLNKELKIKLDENRDLKQKIIEINRQSDNLANRYSQAVKEYQQARKKYLQTQEKLPRLIAEFENLNRVIISQKQQINILKQQNYNLKVQLSSGSSQSLEQKNNMLAEEIKRLNRIIEERDSEISQLRLRYVDDNALEKRINEHLALFVVLFAEIESLRKRLKDKEKEVTDVRRSSLANFIVNNNQV